jgi:ribonuclease P protein component
MARLRFPRAARLLDKAQFDAVFAARRRQHSPLFLLHVAPAAHDVARLGLAIAKRVVPLASERNRLKRIARESFRHLHATLPAFDLVLVAKNTAAAQTARALRSDLDTLFSGLAALKLARADGTIAPSPAAPDDTRGS